MGEVRFGGGAAIWPLETRGGYLLGVRAAVHYDWFFGLSLSIDSTDAFDRRPGAVVLWSVRYALRPEHRLTDDVSLWGAIEAGIAMSQGQGPLNAQQHDELAFTAALGLGARFGVAIVGLYVDYAFSDTTHRPGAYVAAGADFHL